MAGETLLLPTWLWGWNECSQILGASCQLSFFYQRLLLFSRRCLPLHFCFGEKMLHLYTLSLRVEKQGNTCSQGQNASSTLFHSPPYTCQLLCMYSSKYCCMHLELQLFFRYARSVMRLYKKESLEGNISDTRGTDPTTTH